MGCCIDRFCSASHDKRRNDVFFPLNFDDLGQSVSKRAEVQNLTKGGFGIGVDGTELLPVCWWRTSRANGALSEYCIGPRLGGGSMGRGIEGRATGRKERLGRGPTSSWRPLRTPELDVLGRTMPPGAMATAQASLVPIPFTPHLKW